MNGNQDDILRRFTKKDSLQKFWKFGISDTQKREEKEEIRGKPTLEKALNDLLEMFVRCGLRLQDLRDETTTMKFAKALARFPEMNFYKDLAARLSKEQGRWAAIQGRAIPGTLNEVALVLRNWAESGASKDIGEALGFLSTTVAETLDRFEKMDTGPETLVANIWPALPFEDDAWQVITVPLTPLAQSYLLHRGNRMTLEYGMAWAVVSASVTSDETKATIFALAGYWELLSWAKERWAQSPPSPEEQRLVGRSVYNVAGRLVHWAQADASEFTGETVEDIQYQLASASAILLASLESKGSRAAFVWRNFSAAGTYLERKNSVAAVLLHVRAAEVLMHNLEYDRVAAQLFNAGVSIGRGKKKQTEKSHEMTQAEFVLLAFGLYWSLRFNEDSPIECLVAGSGIDCARNLFGTVLELRPSLIQPAEGHLTALSNVLAPYVDELVGRGNVHAMAVRSTWRQLHWNPSSEDRLSPAQLRSYVLAALSAFAENAPRSDQDAARFDWLIEMLRKLDPNAEGILSHEYESLWKDMEKPHEAFLARFKEVETKLQSLAIEANVDLMTRIEEHLENVRKMAPSSLAQIFRELPAHVSLR